MEDTTPYQETPKEKRIHHRLRLLAKYRRIVAQVWQRTEPDMLEEYPRWNYDHFAKCSCWMCGNPRRHFKEQSVQESKAEEAWKQECKELGLRFPGTRFRKSQ